MVLLLFNIDVSVGQLLGMSFVREMQVRSQGEVGQFWFLVFGCQRGSEGAAKIAAELVCFRQGQGQALV